MATLTTLTKSSVMGIIPGMTTVASRLKFNLIIHRRINMAAITSQPLMGSIKWVIGLPIVVKLPKQPIIGVVTGGALFTQRLLMDILLGVTVLTFKLRYLK